MGETGDFVLGIALAAQVPLRKTIERITRSLRRKSLPLERGAWFSSQLVDRNVPCKARQEMKILVPIPYFLAWNAEHEIAADAKPPLTASPQCRVGLPAVMDAAEPAQKRVGKTLDPEADPSYAPVTPLP